MIEIKDTFLSQYANSPTLCTILNDFNDTVDPRASTDASYRNVTGRPIAMVVSCVNALAVMDTLSVSIAVDGIEVSRNLLRANEVGGVVSAFAIVPPNAYYSAITRRHTDDTIGRWVELR